MVHTSVSIIIPSLFKKDFNFLKTLKSILKQVGVFKVHVYIELNGVPQEQFNKVMSLWRDLLKSDLDLVKLNEESPFIIELNLHEEAQVNKARNRGLINSKGELVFFFDDDCLLDDVQLLKKTIQLFIQRPDVYIMGGQYHLEPDSDLVNRFYNKIQMNWLRQTRYLIGGFFAIRRSTLENEKLLFNENMNYGSSEVSFFHQALTYGYRIVLLPFSILHKTQENIFSLFIKAYKQGRGQGRLVKDNLVFGEEIKPVVCDNFYEKLLFLIWNSGFWWGFEKATQGSWGPFLSALGYFKRFVLKTKYKLIDELNLIIFKKKSQGDQI